MKLNKFLFWSTRISTVLWIFCIVTVIILFGAATKWFTGIIQDTQLGNSKLFTTLSLSLVGLGVLSFGILILSIIIDALLKMKIIKFERSFKGVSKFLLKTIILLAFLPLFLLYNVSGVKDFILKIKKKEFKFSHLKPINSKALISRLVGIIAISATLLPMWVGGYFIAGMLIKEGLNYGTEIITVAGTGSMFPTFPKGQGKDPKELAKEIVGTPGMIRYPNGLVIGGKRYFGYQIGRGDIVVVENEKIREINQESFGTDGGWIKRIIGLPGDNIELKGGIVYLNDEPLKEQYTAKARSTFGESFLSECKRVTIPENSVFFMGDNRKGSGDSREIGFVSIEAINHVLPLKNQVGILDKGWRDTSKDLDEASKIKLDKDKYLELLNEKRKEAGDKPIKYQPKLEESANKRGETILKFDDFSFEATQSGYTMSKAMRDANYSNIVWGEAPTQGYYEAEELIDNQFQFPESKKFLLDKTYQEVGIAEVEGEINGCPTQVIVQHFAGYVPPNYKQTDIDSWKPSLAGLKGIQSGWAGLKNYQKFYQENKTDVDKINNIISQRIANITAIISRMEANQWLSKAENDYISQDEVLYKEQEALSNKLNSR
ncbi:MAG: signal peptidase I [Candidatus Shapirobacteria bacterium]|nr:signal peptidase I [Candidatus Shapirobacteria bacterium]